MKDYIAISREIKRRGEAKRNARRRRIHHALAACILLCICLPVGFGVWQWASPAEAPSLPPVSGIVGEGENLQGDSKEPILLPGESLPEQEEPDYSEEPREEEPGVEPEEPVYSEEPREEASEEPDYSEEPWEEDPEEEPGQPLPPETPESSSVATVRLPDGSALEILLFSVSDSSEIAHFPKEAIGVIGVMVEGKWDPKQGYIFLTEENRIPNDIIEEESTRLETIFEEAELEYPSHSLTVEEAEELLFMLYRYYR